jgi:hypothetical protein
MKLIEFKNNELVISDEAYHIKVFRDIWDNDKGDYNNSLNIFGYLYFFYHPGSDFNYITDEEEKEEIVLSGLGISDRGFLSDEVYKRAVEVYKKMVITTSSRMIENNRKRLAKLDAYLDNTNIDDDNVSKYTKAISDMNKLGIEIANAEKEIYKDIEEQSAKVRGKVQLTIGDHGL